MWVNRCRMCPAVGRFRRLTIVLLGCIVVLQNGCRGFPCQTPGRPTRGDFTPKSEKYNANDKVEYRCEVGYTLFGDPASVCRSNGAWSSQAPMCLANLAFQRRTEQSDGSGSDRAVDGYEDTCTSVGPMPSHNAKLPPKRWWVIQFTTSTTVTHINVLLYKGSAYSLSISIGKKEPPNTGRNSWAQIPAESLQPFCHIQGATATNALKCGGPPLHPVHGVRFILIEMSHHHNGNQIPFNLCEVQVFNQFGDSSNTKQLVASDGTKESDPYFTTIIGIAVGATVASVAIVSAITVVVCLLKKHLFKPVPTSDHGSSDISTSEMRQRHSSSATTPTRATYRSSDSRYSLQETEYTTADSVATDHVYDYIKHQQVAKQCCPLPDANIPNRSLPSPLQTVPSTSNGEISVDNDIYRSSSSSNSSSTLSLNGKKRQDARTKRRQALQDDVLASEDNLQPLVFDRDYDDVHTPPPVGPRDYDMVYHDGNQQNFSLYGHNNPQRRVDSTTEVPETSL